MCSGSCWPASLRRWAYSPEKHQIWQYRHGGLIYLSAILHTGLRPIRQSGAVRSPRNESASSASHSKPIVSMTLQVVAFRLFSQSGAPLERRNS
jgi:hypothetical protein